MHLNPVSLCLLTALTTSITNLAIADTKLTYTDSGIGPQERKTVIQINGDKVRMGEADSNIYSLYDDSKKMLYTINTKTKQYIETTPDKMRERMTKVADMQKQFKEEMKKQIAQMPEDQRKPIEERMKQADEAMKAPPPSFKMEKTDRKETIQGMECTISTVKMDDKAVRDVCIAGNETIPASDQKMLVTMFEYMDSISVESAKAQGMTPPTEGSASVHKEGLALRIQALPEGPRSEISAVGKEDLNDADFTLPTGFAIFEPSMAPPAAAPAEATPATATPAPAPAAK